MVAAIPARMPVEHAEALNRILTITRREWGLEQTARTPSGPTDTQLSQATRPPRASRRKQLAALAARAFEAQVMALRCRQAFVG